VETSDRGLIFRYFPASCPGGIEKTTKNLRIASESTNILTMHFSNEVGNVTAPANVFSDIQIILFLSQAYVINLIFPFH
jgi:hypothetical protein